jgi:hypothetical protein
MALFVLLEPGVAAAQVQITPAISITPTKTVTPWVFQMAIATVILGVIVVLGLAVSYLRFAPAFFGRKEAPPQPPGSRPTLMTQAQAVGRASAGATRPAAASSGSVAVAERPAPAVAAPAAQVETPAPAAEAPAAEAPAAEAPAAEAPAAEAPTPAPQAPPSPPAGGSRGAALDQETFDRVLEEQLAKGVDRRVAEGRARAAAVVAARKKAQG